jgi:hypothetical protein
LVSTKVGFFVPQIGHEDLPNGSLVIPQRDRLIQNPRCPIGANMSLDAKCPAASATQLTVILGSSASSASSVARRSLAR